MTVIPSQIEIWDRVVATLGMEATFHFTSDSRRWNKVIMTVYDPKRQYADVILHDIRTKVQTLFPGTIIGDHCHGHHFLDIKEQRLATTSDLLKSKG